MEPVNNVKCNSKPSRPKNPVDVDDYPSVDTRDMCHAKGEIPFSVFTTPHDDVSTLANDTIGHTVYHWDTTDGVAKRWISSRQHRIENNHKVHPPSISHSDFAFEVKEWPKLDSVADENETPTIDDDAVFSLHKVPTHGVASNDFQEDFVFHQTDACEADLRRRGHGVVLVILGFIVGALLVGLVLVFILSRDGKVDQHANSANQQQESGANTARPSPSPVMIPMIPDDTIMTAMPTVAPSILAPDPNSQIPWPIGTTSPTQTLSSAYPSPSRSPIPSLPPIQQSGTELPTYSQYSTHMPTPPTTLYGTPSPILVSPTLTPTVRPSLGSSATGTTFTLAQENFLGLLQFNASSDEYLKPFYTTVPSSVASVSPQWRALEWLTTDPNYYTYRDERKLQRYALAVFGFGLESLPDNETWLNYNIHECDWYTTATSGSACSSNHNQRQAPGDLVQRLELDNMGLVGTLPVELGLLSNTLTQIYLRNNYLSGTLPSIWGRDFQKLQRFQLTNAKLEGTLPPEWGQMGSLAVLGLGRNQLNGSLPEEWAMNGGMQSLGTLGLESNQLTGTIPTAWGNGGMPSLIRLYLNKNFLTGQVPDSLWSPNAWMEVNLAGNALTGIISDSTCAISTLAQLVADCNSGHIMCNCCTVCV